MKVVTVPHSSLRSPTKPIEQLDKKNVQLLRDLEQTLKSHRNPRGVGLAAPQIDVSKQVFTTLLSPRGDESGIPILRWFINPVMTDHSEAIIFGENPDEPALEGCLSIPHLYGPVPRYEWVKFQYLTWDDKSNVAQLLSEEATFTNFAARVMQHEFDHLQGVLFTDYSLKYDLPVYQENKHTGKLEEIDKRVLESW